MVWVQVLRDTLNCSLPIEIIYNGPREMDEWAVNKFQVLSLLRGTWQALLQGLALSKAAVMQCKSEVSMPCIVTPLQYCPHRMHSPVECEYAKPASMRIQQPCGAESGGITNLELM